MLWGVAQPGRRYLRDSEGGRVTPVKLKRGRPAVSKGHQVRTPVGGKCDVQCSVCSLQKYIPTSAAMHFDQSSSSEDGGAEPTLIRVARAAASARGVGSC